MAFGRLATPILYASVHYTGGNYGTGSVGFGWREPFGSSADVPIKATTGDLLQVSLIAMWSPASGTDWLDVVCVTSYQHIADGTTAGIASTTGRGCPAWSSTSASDTEPIAGSVFYVVAAGDTTGGVATLRAITRTTAGRTLNADNNSPFFLQVINHGRPS